MRILYAFHGEGLFSYRITHVQYLNFNQRAGFLLPTLPIRNKAECSSPYGPCGYLLARGFSDHSVQGVLSIHLNLDSNWFREEDRVTERPRRLDCFGVR